MPLAWKHSPNTALLGDAARLLPPLGVGVNLTMLDAAELAGSIASAATIEQAVTDYEAAKIPRSDQIAQLLDGGAEMLFDDRVWAPRGRRDGRPGVAGRGMQGFGERFDGRWRVCRTGR